MIELVEDNTLDITGLVEAMEDTWVRVSTETVLTALAVQWPWVKIPFIETVMRYFMAAILMKTAKTAEMQAFFVNTIFRKASQASEYVATIQKKKELSPHASEEEYEALEKQELAAFRNFVLVTN